jgi:hypothetical protein
MAMAAAGTELEPELEEHTVEGEPEEQAASRRVEAEPEEQLVSRPMEAEQEDRAPSINSNSNIGSAWV